MTEPAYDHPEPRDGPKLRIAHYLVLLAIVVGIVIALVALT